MRMRLLPSLLGCAAFVVGFAVHAQTGPAPGATWQFLGPNNLDVPYPTYYGVRPTSGRVSALAWSRSNTNVIYAGGGGGGVWKTTDGGVTWAVTGSETNSTWTFVQVDSVAVDPTDENTVYAGSGSWRNLRPDQYHPIGLLKSSDGGTTWKNVMPTNQVISKIVVDPDNPQMITFAAFDNINYQGQIWRSTNGGAAWYPAFATQGSWRDLCVSGRDKTGKRYYYAVGYDNNTRPLVRVSTNQPAGGPATAWTDIMAGATPPALNSPANTNNASLSISASQVNPKTVYLMGGDEQTIQQSQDAGTTWAPFSGGFISNYGPGAASNWGQSSYDYHIEAAWIPGTSVDVVYVGLITIAGRCSDAAPWTDIGQTGTATPPTHNDQQSLAFNPFNPNQILFGNDGGIYTTIFNPATRKWGPISAQANATLGLTQFYGAAFDPSNPANILGGAQDQASPRSYGAASPRAPAAASLANWNNGVGGDGGNCAINPVLPLVQFGEVGGFRQDSVGRPLASLFGTTNGWASSNALINGFPTSSFTPPFALDGTGATSNTVFYGTITNIIYYASDYMHRIAWDGVNVIVDTQLGATQLTGGGNGVGSPGFLSFSTQPAFVNAVALAPGDNNRLYAGSTDGTLWMTRHARATNTAMAVHWEQINTGNPALPVLAVNCIAVDPYNQNRVFVGFAGSGDGLSHVWVCQDVSQLTANRVWTPAATNGLLNVPVNGIALDPADPTNTWYIGTDSGVSFTRNAGAAWLDGSHAYGLPAVQVNNLQSMPGTGKLNAATYGRGVWNLTLNNGIQQIAGFGITPNPIASNALNLAVGRITLSKPAPPGGVSIQITNDHPSTYNFTNQFIPAGQISTFFFVLGLDQQPGSNITFTAILGSESHNTVLQVVDPASGRALFSENTIVASLSLDGTGNAKVSFLSEPGITYVLEYKNSLSDPAWTPLPPGAAGTGGVLVLQDTTGPQPRRFYRVVGSPGL